jgi:hypothetical protein
MPLAPLQIQLSSDDDVRLQTLLAGGTQPVRCTLRALILIQMAQGVSATQIARFVPLSAQAIRKIGHRFEQGGLDRALYDKERPGAVALLDDGQKQRLLVLARLGGPEQGGWRGRHGGPGKHHGGPRGPVRGPKGPDGGKAPL